MSTNVYLCNYTQFHSTERKGYIFMTESNNVTKALRSRVVATLRKIKQRSAKSLTVYILCCSIAKSTLCSTSIE